jgi:hypothetical protein
MMIVNDILNNRALRVLIIFIPCLIWDIFFFCVKVLYNTCLVIDRIGGTWIEKFAGLPDERI